MKHYTLSTGDTIILSKIESISFLNNKTGYKGALHSFTIHMDSGHEILVENIEDAKLFMERDYLLKLLEKEK
jgi:hypothetical protein